MADDVQSYYDRDPGYEWERLFHHRTEFALTMRALQRHLPPGARVLDVGGGPGRYSLALTQLGHRVTLLDLAQGNLDFARAKAAEQGLVLEAYVKGNALDLSAFAPGSFDAVLLMGPLYHLLEEAERVRAVRESLRLLRSGGLLASSVILRYAFVRDLAASEPEVLRKWLPVIRQIIDTGVYHKVPEGNFTDHYAFRPFDFQPWMESLGLTTVEVLGQEGLVCELEEKVNGLTGEDWEAWVTLNEEAARDPSTWGCCAHLLHIGKARTPD